MSSCIVGLKNKIIALSHYFLIQFFIFFCVFGLLRICIQSLSPLIYSSAAGQESDSLTVPGFFGVFLSFFMIITETVSNSQYLFYYDMFSLQESGSFIVITKVT